MRFHNESSPRVALVPHEAPVRHGEMISGKMLRPRPASSRMAMTAARDPKALFGRDDQGAPRALFFYDGP